MKKNYGFYRVAAISPATHPAALKQNLDAIVTAANEASKSGADVAIFPELALTGYTCGDLLFQPTLLDGAVDSLASFIAASRDLRPVFIVGLPLRVRGAVYNVAAVVKSGELLGVVPKTYLPNTREFSEARWFASADAAQDDEISVAGFTAPFGADLVFENEKDSALAIGVEICEDLWSPVPPSTFAALSGATIICNPSASDELAGKSDYRRELLRQQSARCIAGYAYAGSGCGESSSDMVFGGHTMIAENGRMLADGRRFEADTTYLYSDVDCDALLFERSQTSSFAQAAECAPECRAVKFSLEPRDFSAKGEKLMRELDPLPFVPAKAASRAERCAEIFSIQSTGLATRMRNTGISKAVIGLSGGLDSTLALLVAVEAARRVGADPADSICAITMPGFGTSRRTLRNTRNLCKAFGIKLEVIPINAACKRHLADIGHDGVTGDSTFENSQARERTQIIMDKANAINGLVIGTGDLSELALGWCTYNGDQMSMYSVNCGVPKTLARHLVAWYGAQSGDRAVAAALQAVLDTPISPELLPTDKNGDIAQKTEDIVGPYELHDFFLYHFLRRGAEPAKIAFLAENAFRGEHSRAAIRKWLKVFMRRFFTQQFKRSCSPDGPKVGTVCLSPRGDWRMPSDADGSAWQL